MTSCQCREHIRQQKKRRRKREKSKNKMYHESDLLNDGAIFKNVIAKFTTKGKKKENLNRQEGI